MPYLKTDLEKVFRAAKDFEKACQVLLGHRPKFLPSPISHRLGLLRAEIMKTDWNAAKTKRGSSAKKEKK